MSFFFGGGLWLSVNIQISIISKWRHSIYILQNYFTYNLDRIFETLIMDTLIWKLNSSFQNLWNQKWSLCLTCHWQASLLPNPARLNHIYLYPKYQDTMKYLLFSYTSHVHIRLPKYYLCWDVAMKSKSCMFPNKSHSNKITYIALTAVTLEKKIWCC